MKRNVIFTIEEIIQIYNPSNSMRLGGMVDVIKTTKGFAEIDENGEVGTFSIDESEVNTYVGDRYATASDKGIFRNLINKVVKLTSK